MLRYNNNPVVTKEQVPNINTSLRDVSSVFNPGGIKFGEKYLLMLRVQNRGRRTSFIMAESDNGKDFRVDNKIVVFKGLENLGLTVHHLYDPRITKLGDHYFII